MASLGDSAPVFVPLVPLRRSEIRQRAEHPQRDVQPALGEGRLRARVGFQSKQKRDVVVRLEPLAHAQLREQGLEREQVRGEDVQVGRQVQRAVEGDGVCLRESDTHPHDFFSHGNAPFRYVRYVFGRYIFFRLVGSARFFFFFFARVLFVLVRRQDRAKRLLERRRAEHRRERRVDARHGGGEGASCGFARDRRVRFAERVELFKKRRRRQRRPPQKRVRHRGRSRLLQKRAHRRRAQPRVGGGAARHRRGDRRKRFGDLDVDSPSVDVDEPFKPRRRRVAFRFVSVNLRRRNRRPDNASQFLDKRLVVQLCRFVNVASLRVAPGAVNQGGRFLSRQGRRGRGRKQRPEQRRRLGATVRREQLSALRRLQVPQNREALSFRGGYVCG